MNLRKRLSFQTKLVAALLFVVLLVTALGYTLVKLSVDRAFADLTAREGRAYDQWVRNLIARYPSQRGNLEGIGQFLEGGPRPLGFVLTDPQGRVVLARDESLIGRTLPRQELAAGTAIELPDGTRWTLVPETPSPPNPLHDRFMGAVNYALWIAGTAAAGIALIFASFLLRHVTGPLRRLSAAARKIADGDLAARVEEVSEDELGNLSRSFNAMAVSLEEAERSKRQMIADVAHELRTPITVLRTAVEGFEDGVLEPTPENLAALKDKIHLTARLIDDLQQLALADMGRLSLHQEPFPLGEVIADIAGLIGPQLEDGGIRLSRAVPPDLPPVSGDRQRVQQVLLNLFANAIRHTPPGGEIAVTASLHEDSMVLVSLCNSGTGLSREDEARLFDRFYRGAEARASGSGAGLGLSVAKAIVEAHGGRIWAENCSTGGACFHCTLPLASRT
ncbi:MAG: ATP-binding protein [Candidatus Bipolaricaulota bacterium]